MKSRFILFLLLSFIIRISIYSIELNDETYNLAVSCENQGEIKEAVKHYEEYIKKINDSDIIEKIILKIARIIPDYDESVKYYKYLFSKNPDSKYKFIARYELGILHKLNNNNSEALKEFTVLLKESKENKFYFEKANINIAEIEIEDLNYNAAIDRLTKMINKSEDYDDNAIIYYLLGLTKFKQGLLNDAEKYFLTVVGTYPLSSKGAASLYDLVIIYKNSGRINDEEKKAKMLMNFYPDSLEALKIKEIVNTKTLENDNKNSGVDLIELKKDMNNSNDFQDYLKNDLNNSIILTDEKNNDLESDYYIQLGYFSTKENADLIADSYRKKGIKDIIVAKTRSNDSKKIFYRVVTGPYINKEDANQKNLELKDKKIEAIILELFKYYE